MEEKFWYTITNAERIDSPTLLFYPERINANISLAKDFVTDVTYLRPHVKTHKCIEITQLMLDAGITKFKCATIAEAEMLALAKSSDVLLAYQPTLAKIHRLVNLIEKYPETQFACLIDNEVTAELLAAEAQKAGITISIFIDVNIGMNRTGILPSGAFTLYQSCLTIQGISVKGLHAYDGHIYTTDLQQRMEECLSAFKPVVHLIAQITAAGYPQPVIVAGGTPTFPIFAQLSGIECSPGTFVLWDEGYRKSFPDLPFLPAALVLTRVISIVDEYTVCLDMGHKAVAAENDLQKRVIFLNAPDVEFVGHSEEHMVIRSTKEHTFRLGDILYGLPVHICPTCALYDRATVVINGVATDEWKIIARDRIITI